MLWRSLMIWMRCGLQFRDKYIQVKDCTENMTAFVMHLLEE